MKSAETAAQRSEAFGQNRPLTAVDRFGTWLSARALRHSVPSFAGLRVGDFGCGYQARFIRSVLGEVAHAVIVDVALAPDLKQHERVRAIEGTLPDAVREIDDRELDVVMCTSVLEHLWEPADLLGECRRILAPGGVCAINVPTWRGKRFLEFSAFRLGLSPPDEMDDHKTYYDPRDLWPLLVRAGFLPHNIRCRKHKFGLNLWATCRVEST
jgi:2-polyprenyl-3-methyl-5-hydroxy-6-metoxy-1,4-benzoquinol methylase